MKLKSGLFSVTILNLQDRTRMIYMKYIGRLYEYFKR